MYLVINKYVTAVKVSNFSGYYLRNCSTLDIGVLGYIGIGQHKEHSPEVLSIPPGTLCILTFKVQIQNLVEDNSYFFVFHSNFHILDLFSSNSFCPKLRCCAIKFGAACTCHCISSDIYRFSIIMMFRFHGSAGLSGCCGQWVHMRSLGMERNEYIYLFLWLVQYGTRSICPSFCCKDFFVTFLNFSFMLM